MIFEEAAPAKINLALHVRGRRADGYHDLETIFAFTEFGDRLSAEPADALTLTVDGPFAADVPAGEDNLILRAAGALLDLAPKAAHPERSRGTHGGAVRPTTSLGMSGVGSFPGATLRLTKNLPVASGIGGGSADAAAALRLLNRLWGLDCSLDDLARVGATLGADIPACVYSRSLRGEGRGDALAPFDTGLSGTPVLLVNPRVGVSTAAVFAKWDGVDRGPLTGIERGRNDLEAAATQVAPVISDVLRVLQSAHGVTMARMSGSGATCFACFTDNGRCADAAAASAGRGWWVQATSFYGASPLG